jgi:hypothetical protein
MAPATPGPFPYRSENRRRTPPSERADARPRAAVGPARRGARRAPGANSRRAGPLICGRKRAYAWNDGKCSTDSSSIKPSPRGSDACRAGDGLPGGGIRLDQGRRWTGGHPARSRPGGIEFHQQSASLATDENQAPHQNRLNRADRHGSLKSARDRTRRWRGSHAHQERKGEDQTDEDSPNPLVTHGRPLPRLGPSLPGSLSSAQRA